MLILKYVSIVVSKDSEYKRSKLLEDVISQLENDIVKSEMSGKLTQFGRIKAADLETNEITDYEEEAGETNIMPSIRDNEYIQPSMLWGAQFMSGMDMSQRLPLMLALTMGYNVIP